MASRFTRSAVRVGIVAVVALLCAGGCGAPDAPYTGPAVMDGDEFWSLIDRLRVTDDGDVMLSVVAGVDEHLSGRPPAYILAYHRRFVIENHRAYRPELFEAAVLAGVAGGDDSFTDFRSWLIAQGRETFERVLAEPDELAGLTWDDDLEDFSMGEALGARGYSAYEEAGGGEMPDDVLALESPETAEPGSGVPPGNPVGAGEPYDDAMLQRMFPRLWARFR